MRSFFSNLFVLLIVFLYFADAQLATFPFGNQMGDICMEPGDLKFSEVPLLQPMTYYESNVTSVTQVTDGFIYLYKLRSILAGYIDVYFMSADTTNGGQDQNQICMRAGNQTDDLILAQDIIAGTGFSFTPKAIVVATWYKVDAFMRRTGKQNTFQIIIPYSDTGETWLIFAYTQLQYFESDDDAYAVAKRYDHFNFECDEKDRQTQMVDYIEIDSDEKMNQLLSETNCNRAGVYAYKIPQSNEPSAFPSTMPLHGPSVAPSSSPIEVPFASPSSGPSDSPIEVLSKFPTSEPSTSPIEVASNNPSAAPSTAPFESPSTSPFEAPSTSPSAAPSTSPFGVDISRTPSAGPSTSPVTAPTTDTCAVRWNLFNSETNALSAALTNGVIIANPPPCGKRNIEAVVPCGATKKAVIFELWRGTRRVKRRKNTRVPYFFFGNDGSDVFDGSIVAGSYGIRAVVDGTMTPFTNFTIGGQCP